MSSPDLRNLWSNYTIPFISDLIFIRATLDTQVTYRIYSNKRRNWDKKINQIPAPE